MTTSQYLNAQTLLDSQLFLDPQSPGRILKFWSFLPLLEITSPSPPPPPLTLYNNHKRKNPRFLDFSLQFLILEFNFFGGATLIHWDILLLPPLLLESLLLLTLNNL
jgi:hypothetical protein